MLGSCHGWTISSACRSWIPVRGTQFCCPCCGYARSAGVEWRTGTCLTFWTRNFCSAAPLLFPHAEKTQPLYRSDFPLHRSNFSMRRRTRRTALTVFYCNFWASWKGQRDVLMSSSFTLKFLTSGLDHVTVTSETTKSNAAKQTEETGVYALPSLLAGKEAKTWSTACVCLPPSLTNTPCATSICNDVNQRFLGIRIELWGVTSCEINGGSNSLRHGEDECRGQQWYCEVVLLEKQEMTVCKCLILMCKPQKIVWKSSVLRF